MSRKKQQPANRWRRRIILVCVLALLIVLAGFFGFAALNANTLYLRRATVEMADLPPAFDGKTLLFISDIDLCGMNTPEKSGAAIKALQSLNPDMLILGGDYASPSLLDILNSTPEADLAAEQAEKMTSFFHYIRDFSAPLGKYVITAPDDRRIPEDKLNTLFNECGFQYLKDTRVSVNQGGDVIWLAGLCSDALNIGRAGASFKKSDCAIAITYTPGLFPQLMTSEASDGGHWVDLALTGHTHGGQVRIMNRNLISLTSQEQQYLYGWTRETGVPMLTTSGMGCEGVNLRFGAQAEAWFITLTRPDAAVELPDLRE